MGRKIHIVEVGPRDGLQNDPANLSVDQKLEFIARLEAAGVTRMESGSFVSQGRCRRWRTRRRCLPR